MPLYSQIVPQDATILLLSDKVIKIWSKKKKKQILLIKLNDNLSKLGTSALPLYRQHGCDRFWRATTSITAPGLPSLLLARSKREPSVWLS
jgi:hypothetical protein